MLRDLIFDILWPIVVESNYGSIFHTFLFILGDVFRLAFTEIFLVSRVTSHFTSWVLLFLVMLVIVIQPSRDQFFC